MEDDQATSILRGVLRLGRRLRAERPDGTTSLSALSILATLHRRGPMVAVALAAEERLQPQSLTRLIAGLERDGLIERTPNEADRRALVIAPTRQGLAVLAADMSARRRWLERAMTAALTDEERDTLVRASHIMLKLADAEDSAVSPLTAARNAPAP